MRPEDLYDAFHEIDDDLLKPLPEAAPRRHPALAGARLRPAPCWLQADCSGCGRGEKTAPQPSLAVPTLASEPTAGEPSAAGEPAIPEACGACLRHGAFCRRCRHQLSGGLFYPHAVRGAAGLHLGQETLWLTDAENEVIYDGSGVPWIVRLTVQTADGTLTAELSPEHLPPACLAEPAEETCEVNGVPVAAAAGPSHAVVSFVRGEGADAVGMRITMKGSFPCCRSLPRGSSRSRWSRAACCSCISSKRRTFRLAQ